MTAHTLREGVVANTLREWIGAGNRGSRPLAGTNGNGSPPLFTSARTIGGLALIAGAVFVGVVDVIRPDVTADPIQFFLMLGSGLLLLGVQGFDRFLRP